MNCCFWLKSFSARSHGRAYSFHLRLWTMSTFFRENYLLQFLWDTSEMAFHVTIHRVVMLRRKYCLTVWTLERSAIYLLGMSVEQWWRIEFKKPVFLWLDDLAAFEVWCRGQKFETVSAAACELWSNVARSLLHLTVLLMIRSEVLFGICHNENSSTVTSFVLECQSQSPNYHNLNCF